MLQSCKFHNIVSTTTYESLFNMATTSRAAVDGVSDDILRARFLSFLESFPANKVLHNLLDLQPYPFTNIHIQHRAISACRMNCLSPWPWSEPWHACRCLSSASLNNSIAKRLVIVLLYERRRMLRWIPSNSTMITTTTT